MMLRRLIACCLVLLTPLSWADWAADRDGSAGYVTVTTLASVIDEAVPFVYVKLSDLPADFHTAMSDASDTDGKTIRVSSSDGTTQLACAPVGVDTGTDTGALFFLGTGMSASTDVDYRIYVGNASLSMPSDSGGMGCQAVFAAYAGVYLPGVSTKDWTAGGRTLTATGSPGTAASGIEGITAATYNGSSQGHYYSGTQAVTNWPITMESVVRSGSTSTNQGVIGLLRNSDNMPQAYISFTNTNKINTVYRGDGGVASIPTTGASFSADTEYFLVSSRDANAGTAKIYVNASVTNNTDGINAPTFDTLSIGYLKLGTPLFYLNGRVTIALLSKYSTGTTSGVRSADFIATQYDNFNGDLYSVGSWTAASSCNSGSTGWVLFQTAATTSASGTLVDWTNVNNAKVDDSNFASATLDPDGNFESEYLNLTNIAYGTTVPVGADSYTVTVRIKRSRGTGASNEINDLTVQFIDETGTRIGDNKADGTTNWPTTAASVDYTITGHTFDGTEFDADSGLAIRATATDSATDCDAQVLLGEIKIDWTCPGDSAFPLLLISEE